MLHIFLERIQSPLGEVIVGTDQEDALRILDLTDYEARMMKLLDRQYGKDKAVLGEVRKASEAGRALDRYFKGDLRAIERLKVDNGGTDFQRKVWKSLFAFPDGGTT